MSGEVSRVQRKLSSRLDKWAKWAEGETSGPAERGSQHRAVGGGLILTTLHSVTSKVTSLGEVRKEEGREIGASSSEREA
jgi:hypothetical protein